MDYTIYCCVWNVVFLWKAGKALKNQTEAARKRIDTVPSLGYTVCRKSCGIKR